MTVEDRWADGRSFPALDDHQDILDSSVTLADDVTSVSFTRPLVTSKVSFSTGILHSGASFSNRC